MRTYLMRKHFWMHDFLNGGRMWKHFKDVEHIYNDVEYGEKRRKEMLGRLLEHAHKHTSFYRALSSEPMSLADYPIMNKMTYLNHYEEFCAKKEDVIGNKGDFYVVKTSGSTGTPFAVPQDTECRIRRIATIKYENERVDFHSFEPMMHLRSLKHYYSNLSGNIIYKKDLNIFYVDNADLTDDRLKEILDVINSKRIKVVRGYMTTLDMITRYAVEHAIVLTHHPTFISVGELLLESLRHRVADELHCKIISQYGNEECGIFGQSAINKDGTTIILNRANVIFEILKFDSDEPASVGELGRIVVTDMTNYAFPMIRYDIGDVAAIDCVSPQGTLLSIKNLSGRKTDLIVKTNGDYIDLFNSMPKEIFNSPNVKQWQFVQIAPKEYTLRLAVEDPTATNESSIVDMMKQILGDDACVKVEYTEEIPVLSSGKRRIVINEYQKNLTISNGGANSP